MREQIPVKKMLYRCGQCKKLFKKEDTLIAVPKGQYTGIRLCRTCVALHAKKEAKETMKNVKKLGIHDQAVEDALNFSKIIISGG